MRFAIVLLVLLSACGVIRPDATDVVWEGIRAPRTCMWDAYNEHADCIAGGLAYSCLFNKRARHVECARVSPVIPMEHS